jgi:hypothetical protein
VKKEMKRKAPRRKAYNVYLPREVLSKVSRDVVKKITFWKGKSKKLVGIFGRKMKQTTY